ncbi:hypothetical protein [Moorena sp. SIO3I6]|uniref:hypothetical protein n=2 Tax=Moorena TaxID=1155738 RepID=UPI0013F8BB62|nr:hypothetical protein [Moorena sp. SIO3I6]NEP22452.1 hypothetical protein [Moorena sp. SIO3I6]
MISGGIFAMHPEVPPETIWQNVVIDWLLQSVRERGGSRSLERFENTARLLTVVQTCRSQQRCVVNFFAEALRAHIGRDMGFP